jgi:RHS repeat-associated protein
MELSRIHYQRTTSWNAPYTFSGKEKDAETGYGYFGARYYDSGLSIWLSVDPMAEKYHYQTNYVYCINNPVLIIDPNGEDKCFNEFGVYLGDDVFYK